MSHWDSSAAHFDPELKPKPQNESNDWLPQSDACPLKFSNPKPGVIGNQGVCWLLSCTDQLGAEGVLNEEVWSISQDPAQQPCRL